MRLQPNNKENQAKKKISITIFIFFNCQIKNNLFCLHKQSLVEYNITTLDTTNILQRNIEWLRSQRGAITNFTVNNLSVHPQSQQLA